MQASVYIVLMFKIWVNTPRPRYEYEERERKGRRRERKGRKSSLSLEWKEALILFPSDCTPSVEKSKDSGEGLCDVVQ